MASEELTQVLLIVGAVLGLTLLWVVPLLVMVVYLNRRARRQDQQILAAWQAVARALGLAEPVRKLSSLETAGTYRGRPLEIGGSHGQESDSGYTFATVKVASRADVFLRVTAGRMIGVSYVPSGDAELDAQYAFLSRPPELLARVMEDPAIRRALLDLKVSGVTLTPYVIRVGVAGLEPDAQRIRRMVELANDLAELVERQIGTSIPEQAPQAPATYGQIELSAPPIRLRGPVRNLIIAAAVLLVVGCGCVMVTVALMPLVTELAR